jgi:MoxR-like ATPase
VGAEQASAWPLPKCLIEAGGVCHTSRGIQTDDLFLVKSPKKQTDFPHKCVYNVQRGGDVRLSSMTRESLGTSRENQYRHLLSHDIVNNKTTTHIASVGGASMANVVSATAKKIIANVEEVIIGKRQEIVLSLVSYFCEGHILLEDVPGVAKTMLARALAQSVGGRFRRIQCTPDLLPTDITGASIFNPKSTEFEFRAGPIFTQILLADEINRTTPRTQSALLEAMAEQRVTVDGETYVLDPPFLVIATQNSVDHEGTFPLPEAQLDRFMVRLSLGYPGPKEEARMLDLLKTAHPIDTLESVVTANEVIAAQRAVRDVFVDPKIRDYIVKIVGRTRDHDDISLGGSPRASIALYRTSQALAAIRGNDFVLPDDVKRIVPAVMMHRMIIRPESRLRKITAADVLEEILNDVPVPMLSTGVGSP